MKKPILLHLCIIFTVLSSLIYVGVASLYHFFIMGLFVISLRSVKENSGIITSTKKNPILNFTFIWSMYAALSLLFTPALNFTAQYTYYLFLIYLFTWLFIHFLYNTDKLLSTVHFFILFVTIACLVALWEILTGNHLIKDYLDSPLRARLLKNTPGFTYRNPNDFAMFLLQLMPFTLYGLLFEKKRFYKSLSLINIVMLLFVISTTSSRTILIVSLLYTVIVASKFLKKSFFKIIIGVGVLIAVLTFIPEFNELFIHAFSDISQENLATSIETGNGSGRVRINLFLNCLIMLATSGGFGVCAGCHRYYMPLYSYKYYPTGHITVAHNFIAEFLADYGLIMFILLIYFFTMAVKRIGFFNKHHIDQRLKDMHFLLKWSLFLFPLGAITMSSLIQATSLWVTIGFVAAYYNVCEKEATAAKSLQLINEDTVPDNNNEESSSLEV